MNHTRLRMSPWDVPTPAQTPSLSQRLTTAFKKLYRRSWFAPAAPSVSPKAQLRPYNWSVAASLTREAAFGSATIEATCHVQASTRTEALASALYQLSRIYPGYTCATLRADEGPGG